MVTPRFQGNNENVPHFCLVGRLGLLRLFCSLLRSLALESLVEPQRSFGWKNQPHRYCHTLPCRYIRALTRQPDQPKNISPLIPAKQYAHSLQQPRGFLQFASAQPFQRLKQMFICVMHVLNRS